MYKWIIRISAAAVGTGLLVMIKSLNFNPILYIFPLMMILCVKISSVLGRHCGQLDNPVIR